MNTVSQSQSSFFTRIRFFSSLQIYQGDNALSLKGEKPRSLLAYLVLHPRVAHRREMLADMLWPDAEPERVRRNLSDVLYRLQKEIEPSWLIVDAGSIALQVNGKLWVDVWEFESLINSQDINDLQSAIELYTGDLLPELYEDWVLVERELRRSQYLLALETLTKKLEGAGNLRDALLFSRRLILAEPLHEPAHQSYMRILGRLHRYGEALAHYEYLRELLRSELGAEPMKETDLIVASLERERDLATVQIIEEQIPFVGRKMERAAALNAVEAALNGHGSILAIEGEAGIGKSRLLREIEVSAKWRGATVLKGKANQVPGASPFSPLSEALTQFINGSRNAQLEVLLNDGMLAALAPLYPPWAAKAVNSDMPVEHADKLFFGILQLLGQALAQITPLVMELDDLHWADPVLWDCLRAFSSGFTQHGGLLILAYRRADIEKRYGWDIVQYWDREGVLKTISLEPFSVGEVAQFIGEARKQDPAEIHAWTGGNPFFLSEWLTELDSKKKGPVRTLSLRFKALSHSARIALESASVLGENVPYRLWTEVSDLSPLVLANMGDELTTHHWLQPSTTGYVFTHDLVRQAIYGQIEPARKKMYHERAAHILETFEPDNLHAKAFHLEQAGLTSEAVETYRLVAEQDRARFAFRSAQNSLERALTLMPDLETKEGIELVILLAEVSHVTGDRSIEEKAITEALAISMEDDALRLRVLKAAADAFSETGRFVEARQYLESVLELSRKLKDHFWEVNAFDRLGTLAQEQSLWNEARIFHRQALELSRLWSLPYYEAESLTDIGNIENSQGKPAQALPWIKQGIEVHRKNGNQWRAAALIAALTATLFDLGAWDQGLAYASEAIPILEAYGDFRNLASIRHNQARIYQELGQCSIARKNYKENIRFFETFKSKRALSVTYISLGYVAETEGKLEEALSFHKTALGLASEVKSLESIADSLQNMGFVLFRLGRVAEAVPILKDAHANWKSQENEREMMKTEAVLGSAYLVTGEQTLAEDLAQRGWDFFQTGKVSKENSRFWLWNLYQLLAGVGRPNEAKFALRAAFTELTNQAQSIHDDSLHHSFLERVPLNREIIAAYDQTMGTSQVLLVSLAREGVPLGRALRSEDYVSVQWRINTPHDETISGKAERRQYRLKRLLQQAKEQGATPTDDDLARALSVSRRTILRDMQVLAKEIPSPPTRKRKK